MHQSGHSREHFQQTVQFSCLSAMTPRVLGGRFGFSSGYCWVIEGWSMCFSVTPRPLTRPTPGGALRFPFPFRGSSAPGPTSCSVSMATYFTATFTTAVTRRSEEHTSELQSPYVH